MKGSRNIANSHINRQVDERHRYHIQDHFTVTENNVRRLDLFAELEGHSGCVNCLEWNESGSILASGSDDVHVNLWDPFRKKLLVSIPSGHHGNIFSVKFVPNSRDHQIISGAADFAIRVHDVNSKEVLSVCSCHQGRVKRIATDPTVPHLFWSAGEDGVIIQNDLRTSHHCSSSSKPKNILINLKSYTGSKAEAKCLAVNPVMPEQMAVGANDAFVRIYDRRMLKLHDEVNPFSVPPEAVQYFVPGHIPSKMLEYKRAFRSIASTYVAYSPDGKELLVNLGGEQIYIFPMTSTNQKTPWSFNTAFETKPQDKNEMPEKTNGYVNGYNKSHPLPFLPQEAKNVPVRTLPSHIEAIKLLANEAFESKKYFKAIHLYNDALQKCPNSPVLLGNRAAALLKRQWDGDVYTALYDCKSALALDGEHYKAHLRLCRCLYELGRYKEADVSLRHFEELFPNHAKSPVVRRLEADIQRNLKAAENTKVSTSSSSSSDSCSPTSPSGTNNSDATPRPGSESESYSSNLRNYFLRFSRASTDSNSSQVSNDNAEEGDDEVMSSENAGSESPAHTSSSTTDSRNEASSSSSTSRTAGDTASGKKKPKMILFPDEEQSFKSTAIDFSNRFCGHCNTTTDIKEANFFGNYIVAGSDDGSFFIWDKNTANIVRILKGDESIVNCLQPHPSTCLLATSGIESVIRIWTPLAEDAEKVKSSNERVVEDIEDAAATNQKRMALNLPGNFLSMVLSSYRLHTEQEQVDESQEDTAEAAVQCNST